MKTKAKTEPKLDLYKSNQADYVASKKPGLIDVKPAVYLAIAGQGAPGGPTFQAFVGALYGVAFTIKMTRKFGGLGDYSVCKLEAQWWANSARNFSQTPKEQWQWKLLIRTPDFVRQDELQEAVKVLLKRGKPDEVKLVGLESLAEGTCVQMLHVGPYDQEPESVAQMKSFAEAQGFHFEGKHHEIYLSDPRRLAPERLKTILRIPVTKQES